LKNSVLIWVILSVLPACRKTPAASSKHPWADYKKGYTLLGTHKDSAFFYFNRAASNSNDKEQVALAYYNMALIQAGAGDNYGAQESLTMSLKSLDERLPKDRDYMATDYNELGMTCSDLDNNTDALVYYRLALHYTDDKNLRPYMLNNLGNAYKKLKSYDKALASYKEVIRLTGKTGTSYARVLTNLALTKWLRDRGYNAAPELLESLAIRLQQNDRWGENSSYAHLADFYMDSRPDSALYYSNKMFTVAGGLQSPDDELEALQKLIILSPPAEVKAYFRRYHALSDSLVASRSAAKNQFALIRYNVEKSKTENLLLQKENTEKRYQLAGLVIVFALGSVLALFWYRKRKQSLQLEARKRELRISQKVHDVVANGLYTVMNTLENQEDSRNGPILDQIEVLYEQSRDISYEQTEIWEANFHEKLTKLITAFASTETKVAVAGNNSGSWEKVNTKARHELEQVLQELMVNMKKHSRATSVAVRFERLEDQLQIVYTDNGIGFPPEVPYGNGLTNTGNRIQGIGGTVTFDTKLKKGVKIFISLPLT
jgi:signal transduction histidine kinase